MLINRENTLQNQINMPILNIAFVELEASCEDIAKAIITRRISKVTKKKRYVDHIFHVECR